MARAKPDVTFQWERLIDVLEEALPLIQLHAGELGQEIEPNWEAYKQYALADILQILTVRDKGMLVGYNAVVVFPSLYCKSEVQAYMTFWLHPAWRYGWTGVRLLREAERQLKRRDVKRVIIDLRYCGTAAARLLEKLGYGPRSTNFAKELS